jgi:hypothetical protein
MSFTKRIVGKEQIKEIEVDITKINRYILSDCLIFESQEISNKFRKYEKIYNDNRTTVI